MPSAQSGPPLLSADVGQRMAPGERHNLITFLGRLRETADFKSELSRPLLAQRVGAMLAALNGPMQQAEQVHERISMAMERCGDRVIWALHQVELSLKIQAAMTDGAPEAALRSLGRGLLRLEVVQRHAAVKAASLRTEISDEAIEVYLFYEIRLAEVLDLPVATRNMLYPNCADVTAADLEAARAEAQKTDQDETAVQAYLDAWAPWQQLQRQKAAIALPWEKLPLAPSSAKVDLQDTCLITRDSVVDMHQAGQRVAILRRGTRDWQPYDFEALQTWWLEHGNDPLSKRPLRRQDIFRLLA